MKEALAPLGYDVKLEHLPKERCLVNANNGLTDEDAYRVYNLREVTKSKYLNLVRVNQPYTTIKLATFSKHKSYRIDHWSKLKNHKVAIIRGNKTVEYQTNKYVKKDNIYSFKNHKQAFKMLELDRVDILVTELNIGRIHSKLFSNIYTTGEVHSLKMYMYLHKKHSAIIPRIEREIKALRDNGKLKEITKEALKKVSLHDLNKYKIN